MEVVVGPFGPELDLPAYRATLERFYGFYRPVEATLWGAELARLGLDAGARRKAPLLDADLRALGVAAPERLPVCADLPPTDTLGAQLGCLYVLEGSTLGGQMIGRSVRATLGLTPEAGMSFFHGYGPRAGAMWREFLAALAGAGAPDDEVVGAALATFRALRRWHQHDKRA